MIIGDSHLSTQLDRTIILLFFYKKSLELLEFYTYIDMAQGSQPCSYEESEMWEGREKEE